jgi:farnesyl-diphosphate farnesyltransferase
MSDLSLLRGVSRSFYLSIRLLPPALRAPVSVAYLLARATDTLADTTPLAPDRRLAQLHTLSVAIDTGDGADLPQLVEAFAPAQTDPHERQLIQALPQCLAWLNRSPRDDQALIREVLRQITRGQRLDLERFPGDGIHALATAAQLEQYTYLVAGCVGEFWTHLCFRHVRDFSPLPEERMCELGRNFGMGLQLVNILRDARDDLRAGRCYFPEEQLRAAAIAPAEVLHAPRAFQPVWDRWHQLAARRMDMGMKYAAAVNPLRIRVAGALPALLGARTLDLLREDGPHPAPGKTKVPRAEVRGILLRTLLGLGNFAGLAREYVRQGGNPRWDRP